MTIHMVDRIKPLVDTNLIHECSPQTSPNELPVQKTIMCSFCDGIEAPGHSQGLMTTISFGRKCGGMNSRNQKVALLHGVDLCFFC